MAALQSLSEIFNNRFFRIPDYQRGYAWGAKQLTDFWRDIENLDSHRFHYTGVLTLENISKDEAKRLNLWQNDMWLYDKGLISSYIIDGQQRLLTSMILLFVILEAFGDDEEINFTSKEKYLEKYFYNTSSRYKSYIFGYKCDDPSDVFFRKYILEETDVHESIEETLYTANMKNAKEFFRKKISDKTKEELERIAKKLTTGFRYNIYEVDDELDVYVTFETMNNRGKLLSKLELLKDRLIYLSTLLKDVTNEDKDRLRSEINTVWKKVYTFLGKNKNNLLDDDIFLLRHWSIYYKVSNGTPDLDTLLNEYFVLENINNQDAKHKIGFDEIKRYIKSLSECVENWFYINNPHLSPYSMEIQDYLHKINRLNNAVFYPLILAICTKEKNKSMVLEALKSIERFIFLVHVATSRKATTGDSYFCKMACEYYKESSRGIEDVIRDTNDFVDNKNTIKQGFDVTRFCKEISDLFEKDKGYYSWKGIKYFLYEYELYLQEQSHSPMKLQWTSNILDSIDHIFPQSSTFKQGTQWGRILGQYKLNGREKNYLINSLGNLLLLSQRKNSELQGCDFSYRIEHIDKKTGLSSGYRHGSYSENEVASYSKWTPDEIFERGSKMLAFMEKRWSAEIEDKIKLLGLEFLDK